MERWKRHILCYVIVASLFLLHLAEGKKKKPTKQPVSSSETNFFNFLRLALYRLIYGVASMFGQQEYISEYLSGILLPPGAEDGDDDYKDEADGGDDDFDY